MTWVHVDTLTERAPRGSERRTDTGAWLSPPDGAWSDAEAAACGFARLVDVAKPVDTDTATHDRTVQLVAGVPTVVWVQRAKTAEEVAAATAGTVRVGLHARARQALADNAAFLAIASPTQAQTLAQVRKLTRQTNAAFRLLLAVDGARDLLVESSDV